MPVTPTYPGVYIEEVPSGVRTITGVATSRTAFIGRALEGPVNDPVVITSFADFERRFGGLWVDSMMSYAVRDFYLNGGSEAVIVRIESGAGTASLSLTTGGSPPDDALVLDAASPGNWGDNLRAIVDHNTRDADQSVPPPDDNLFNLTVSEAVEGGSIETYFNVSVNPSDPRFVARVLEQSSLLVRVQPDSLGQPHVPGERPLEIPASSPATASGGSDGIDLIGTDFEGSASGKTGIYALEKTDLFNLLCIPPATRNGDTDATVYQAAMSFCRDHRAMLIVDSPEAWGASPATAVGQAQAGLGTLGLSGPAARNAALYFPRVRQVDPLRDRQTDTFVPCGIIAGIMARTDVERGVWKGPA